MAIGLLGAAVAIIAIAGTPRGEKQIREWLVGEQPPAVSYCAGGTWEADAAEGEAGQEGETMTLEFVSEITLENLWDPFALSGPVHSVACGFSNWGLYLEITDVTNLPGDQPGWWDPNTLCGGHDGQIWKVTGGYVNSIPIMGSCWFWVCEGSSLHSGTFTGEIAKLERVSLCEFNQTDETVLTLEFEGCIDENGDAVSIEWSGSPADLDPPVADNLTLSGTFEGCLHKGTGGNRYITQELACNCYAIDLDDWEESFGCPDQYRGRVLEGKPATAIWECVETVAGCDDCLDDAWACATRGGDPHHAIDEAGRVWMAYEYEHDIRVVHRDSPQRDWEEHTPAFEEMQHMAPSICCLTDGRILVAATRWRGKTELMMSPDDGMSWQRPA